MDLLSKLEDPTWVCLMRAPARRALDNASLVLAAVEIAHEIEFDGHQWCLLVPAARESAAQSQLQEFQQENRPRPIGPTPVLVIDSGWAGVLGYLLVIWALPWLENMAAFGWDWRDSGVMDAALVRNGDWWRTVTALTLHGDLGHLVGNSLFGGLFGLLTGRMFGSGFGWLLILLGGIMGNYLNSLVQGYGFQSLGASTASFAALAIVGAGAWRRGYFRGRGWRRSLSPVVGGIAMLIYMGLGGEDTNTDVFAHLFGFAVGFVLGWVAARWPVARGGLVLQLACGAAALALVALAWVQANSG
jgi:membrane associated rhomboid family serine protease